ncbi:hypothetical protein AAG906_026010 [Vitis piasezkii]
MDVSLESKSLPSVGNSRKSYLKVTSRRLAGENDVCEISQTHKKGCEITSQQKAAKSFRNKRVISQHFAKYFSLLPLLAFRISLWKRTSKLWFFMFLSFQLLCPRFHITLLNLGLYLRGTSKLKLTFGGGKPILVGYTDSDMAGDVDNRRSTSSYLMTFSGGAVSWQSRLQKCVALSTIEAEYIVAAKACKELLWMKCFMQELGFKQ